MATYSTRLKPAERSLHFHSLFNQIRHRLGLKSGTLFGSIIFIALIAFELFNYSTTEYALRDLIGDLRFLSIGWATILALAFCGMDFAGIARLFTPQGRLPRSMESWYLLGAWLLAATMNAMLTWWAISSALLGHEALGNEIVSREALLSIVPVFVAILVWLIRVLMIGTFTLSGIHPPRDGDFASPKSRRQQRASTARPIRPAPKPSAMD
jgi:hypothetical protein